MQFILKGGWLKEYVDLYKKYPDNIGCIMLDAQRRITISNAHLDKIGDSSKMHFFVDYGRPPTSGAAEVMYSRKALATMGPWNENNTQFEYAQDSETDMLNRMKKMAIDKHISWFQVMPAYPVSIAIYTDPRGTNARVRGSNRYGAYWHAKQDNLYYGLIDIGDANTSGGMPACIEDVACPIGWSPPIDELGGWLKNPIRPETASKDDYTTLPYAESDFTDDAAESVIAGLDDDIINWLDNES